MTTLKGVKTISRDEIKQIDDEIRTIERAVKELNEKKTSYLTHTDNCLQWVDGQLDVYASKIRYLKGRKQEISKLFF